MKLYHEQEAKGIKKSEIFSVDFTELEEMARDGLLSLSVQLGIKALQIMREEEVTSYTGRRRKV